MPGQGRTENLMDTEFCIIGGGIAGLSIGYHLVESNEVVVLEREKDLAYHTTGRSAALYSGTYVDGPSRALTRLSQAFFLDTPEGFHPHPLHHSIGCIFTATEAEKATVEALATQSSSLEVIDADAMLARVPILRVGKDQIQWGLHETDAFKIDVAAMVDAYRKHILAAKGEIRRDANVIALAYSPAGWQVTLANGETIRARKLINAAGAWGDEIARLAGLQALGLKPLRRTIITFDGPAGVDLSGWPAVGGLAGGYYFMPEAGRLLGSAADEVPSTPCDAQPEEYDLALAAHNIESQTTLEIKQIHHRWAGLRTFSPDRQPVVGYDLSNRDFFWLVGQGGFGIQTAPALSRVAAMLAREESLPGEIETAGLSALALSPSRFT